MTEENRRLKDELTSQQLENAKTLEALEHHKKLAADLRSELDTERSSTRVEQLASELKKERERAKKTWRLNCEQIAGHDAELAEKENEIATLKSLLK